METHRITYILFLNGIAREKEATVKNCKNGAHAEAKFLCAAKKKYPEGRVVIKSTIYLSRGEDFGKTIRDFLGI